MRRSNFRKKQECRGDRELLDELEFKRDYLKKRLCNSMLLAVLM